jgi:hypothetical protein
MSGFIDNGLPNIAYFTGGEFANLDTQTANGSNPQSAFVSLQKLATALLMLGNNQDVTGIANQRFSVSWSIGVTSATLGAPSLPQLITGVEILVGSTGGTDLWIVELHDSTGALVANSALAGTTAGTANIWQKIPFVTPYLAQPGLYFITLIMNGTTAKFRAFNSPGLLHLTQSASGGTFGTNASITPPTTYTVAVGPVAVLYV